VVSKGGSVKEYQFNGALKSISGKVKAKADEHLRASKKVKEYQYRVKSY